MAKKTQTRSRPHSIPELLPEPFVAVRTPLLPFEEYERWTAGLTGTAESRQEDIERLRERLLALLDRPEILEALFVASPSMVDGLEQYRAAPESAKGQRAEKALVRYLMRMMTRSTPFGLFAGCTLGSTGEDTRLSLAAQESYSRHTRLDMDYLFKLVQDLERDPETRRDRTYYPNSSLYAAGDRYRYAESRLNGKNRSHHLVAVERDEYLEAAFETARGGARLSDLVQAVISAVPEEEISAEEAEPFVHELIDAQLLVSELELPVTGEEPIHGLIARLAGSERSRPVAAHLASVRDEIARIDRSKLGQHPDRYREIARQLEKLGTEVELPRLFQVDLYKPGGEIRLGREMIDEVRRAVTFLFRLRGPQKQDGLESFRDAFLERYEPGRLVPLVEVLDEEIGLGFRRSQGIGAEHSPLLQGLDFAPAGSFANQEVDPRGILLLGKLHEVTRSRATELVLTDRDLERLPETETPVLPDALHSMISIAAASEEAIDRGEFQISINGASGPSGAVVLGRFCHGDHDLDLAVRGHLRREEAQYPGAILAEVAHLPEGRLGNILLRPALRPYEIPFLAASGVDEEHRIAPDDLLVTVDGREVTLWSRRLGKRIIPRLTSAHNYALRSLGMYRFLCQLQRQGMTGGTMWDWGVFETLPYLPRVIYGRAVLARAQWRLDREEVERLTQGDEAKRAQSFAALRRDRELPARVMLADGDNELLLDFENPLAIESVASLIKGRWDVILRELFPDPSSYPARSAEGRFPHELVVPFLTAREPRPPSPDLRPRLEPIHYPPGSEWLYAKLYTGTSTADRILTDCLKPWLAEEADRIRNWFFLRYNDPGWHIRLRLEAASREHVGPLSEAFGEIAQELLDLGLVSEVQLATYWPETERYGGPEALDSAHRLFQIDSEAVVSLLELLEGDAGAAARWLLALRGLDDLIGVLIPDEEQQLETLSAMRDGFAAEFQVDAPMRKQLGDKLRRERGKLESILDPEADRESELAPALAVLAERRSQLIPLAEELRAAEADQRLTAPVVSLAPSFAHMFVNRLIRADARAHELVLYDFLHRQLLSRRARRRKTGARAKGTGR